MTKAPTKMYIDAVARFFEAIFLEISLPALAGIYIGDVILARHREAYAPRARKRHEGVRLFDSRHFRLELTR